MAKKLEGKFPNSYMGKPINSILKNINVSLDEFTKICDKFTNKKIFKCDRSGKLIKNKNNEPIKIKYDN